MTKQIEKPISIQHVKSDGDVTTCILDLSLIDLPMVQKMLVIEQLRKTFERLGYFRFDEVTQAYFEQNEDSFLKELASEKKFFRDFREMVLPQAVGPLYEYVHRQVEVVKAVYRQKARFDMVADFRSPSVMYKVFVGHGEMKFNVHNQEDLNGLSKPLLCDFVGCSIEYLDWEYAARMNKSYERLHTAHVSLHRLAYPGDGKSIVGVMNYSREDTILGLLVPNGLRHLENPSRILKMLMVIEKANNYI